MTDVKLYISLNIFWVFSNVKIFLIRFAFFKPFLKMCIAMSIANRLLKKKIICVC